MKIKYKYILLILIILIGNFIYLIDLSNGQPNMVVKKTINDDLEFDFIANSTYASFPYNDFYDNQTYNVYNPNDTIFTPDIYEFAISSNSYEMNENDESNTGNWLDITPTGFSDDYLANDGSDDKKRIIWNKDYGIGDPMGFEKNFDYDVVSNISMDFRYYCTSWSVSGSFQTNVRFIDKFGNTITQFGYFKAIPGFWLMCPAQIDILTYNKWYIFSVHISDKIYLSFEREDGADSNSFEIALLNASYVGLSQIEFVCETIASASYTKEYIDWIDLEINNQKYCDDMSYIYIKRDDTPLYDWLKGYLTLNLVGIATLVIDFNYDAYLIDAFDINTDIYEWIGFNTTYYDYYNIITPYYTEVYSYFLFLFNSTIELTHLFVQERVCAYCSEYELWSDESTWGLYGVHLSFYTYDDIEVWMSPCSMYVYDSIIYYFIEIFKDGVLETYGLYFGFIDYSELYLYYDGLIYNQYYAPIYLNTNYHRGKIFINKNGGVISSLEISYITNGLISSEFQTYNSYMNFNLLYDDYLEYFTIGFSDNNYDNLTETVTYGYLTDFSIIYDLTVLYSLFIESTMDAMLLIIVLVVPALMISIMYGKKFLVIGFFIFTIILTISQVLPIWISFIILVNCFILIIREQQRGNIIE